MQHDYDEAGLCTTVHRKKPRVFSHRLQGVLCPQRWERNGRGSIKSERRHDVTRILGGRAGFRLMRRGVSHQNRTAERDVEMLERREME